MPLGDELSHKLANNEPLTSAETQKLRLKLNSLDHMAAYVAGLQNGGSDVFANSLSANSVSVGAGVFSNLGISVYSHISASVSGTSTIVDGWDLPNAGFAFNDGGVFTDTTIIAQRAGTFFITINGKFESNATGTRELYLGFSIGGTPSTTLSWTGDSKPAVSGRATLLSSVGIIQLNKGDTLGVYYYQNSGVTLDLWVQFTARLIGLALCPLT